MKVAIIGTGYVGLVTGVCLSDVGYDVICVDSNLEKIKTLQSGKTPIFEPKLEMLLQRNIGQKRISFTSNLEEAVDKSTIIFLALPTPPKADGFTDLKFILDVSKDLGKMMKSYKVIVDKSTVPVGTSQKVRETISQYYKGEFDVVSNPEFLKEGFAVDDFMLPDRIVIGASSEKAFKLMDELYKPFLRHGNPVMRMDEKSAELTKYAANSFLATKISFMNEIANYCELIGADVDKVRLGVGADTRIGRRFLFPGIGYGGSCFPKDVQALYHSCKMEDYDFKILDSVMKVNEIQKNVLVEKISNYYKENIKGKKAAVWGLSFKPNTDDIREAPALHIIKSLLSKGVSFNVFDPEGMENTKETLGEKDITYAPTVYETLEDVDFLIICTEWKVFKNADLELLFKKLKDKVIFDGRNIFEKKAVESFNLKYFSIGR